jgi:hypothetical protein
MVQSRARTRIARLAQRSLRRATPARSIAQKQQCVAVDGER